MLGPPTVTASNGVEEALLYLNLHQHASGPHSPAPDVQRAIAIFVDPQRGVMRQAIYLVRGGKVVDAPDTPLGSDLPPTRLTLFFVRAR